MDHLECLVQYHCKQPVSLYSHMGYFGKLKIGMLWLAKSNALVRARCFSFSKGLTESVSSTARSMRAD